MSAPGGEPVQGWSPYGKTTRSTEPIPTVVFGQKEKDIGPRFDHRWEVVRERGLSLLIGRVGFGSHVGWRELTHHDEARREKKKFEVREQKESEEGE